MPVRQDPTGPDRYTVDRFLSDCSERSKEYVIHHCNNYEQFVADEVPADALPPVVMLACYARQYGVDLVDDYVHLLDRYWDEFRTFAHPDKFFSSCIIILDETGQVPTEEGFESIRIPDIYDELFPEEEEEEEEE